MWQEAARASTAARRAESNAGEMIGMMARPRTPEIDRRLVEATRRLLAESGYDALTMEAVAAAAGVGKPALYRRYPSKAHLVFAATVEASIPAELPDTGSLRGDLHVLVHGLVGSLLASPRSAVADQFATAIRGAEFARTLVERSHGPALDVIEVVWRRALNRGEVRADVDGRARLADLSSLLVMRTLYFHEPPGPDDVAAIVDHFLHGVAAPPV